jgi:hypothetical protein
MAPYNKDLDILESRGSILHLTLLVHVLACHIETTTISKHLIGNQFTKFKSHLHTGRIDQNCFKSEIGQCMLQSLMHNKPLLNPNTYILYEIIWLTYNWNKSSTDRKTGKILMKN